MLGLAEANIAGMVQDPFETDHWVSRSEPSHPAVQFVFAAPATVGISFDIKVIACHAVGQGFWRCGYVAASIGSRSSLAICVGREL
jgi:hypothetical protein